MPSVSKYALRFQNRVNAFEEDIEMVDILCIAKNNNELLPEKGKLFQFVDVEKHPLLGTRKATETSRTIVVNHLRGTVYAAYIKDIFEELTAYLKSLLYEAALLSKEKTQAQRLLGEHKVNFSAADILQYQSLDELVLKIAEEIIQALENERSTKALVSKICRKINLPVNESTINDALPYLELRHKLVHTDGQVDSSFIEPYPMFTYDAKGYVILNYAIILAAKEKITRLVLEIDNAAIKKRDT